MIAIFFFSSRRRHTRFDCDWSSDVCSSDLVSQGRRHRGRLGHDVVPARLNALAEVFPDVPVRRAQILRSRAGDGFYDARSEEHTSELQSQSNLVCRLLLEKKKKTSHHTHYT